MAESEDTVLEHPNREKAASKLVRALVIVVLLFSAALVAIITLGGWSALEGARPVQILFVLVYVVLAYFVARWKRGVLPLIAALATLLLIFAAVATPGWFDRDKPGFVSPALDENILGLLCALLVPVQAALILFSMQGFRQAWNVEVERPREGSEPAAA